MKQLTEKDRQEILEIISRPPITQEDLDKCPLHQEARQRRRAVMAERSKDPEKFDAESIARARALGMEIIDENHPFYKDAMEKRRQCLAARKAEQESRVPAPATAKVLAE